MSDQQADTSPKSYILVEFAEPGSAIFRAHFVGVIPTQVLAASIYLELTGKNSLIQQENDRVRQEAEQKLAVPRASILRPGE